jgi:hypothetical protein
MRGGLRDVTASTGAGQPHAGPLVQHVVLVTEELQVSQQPAVLTSTEQELARRQLQPSAEAAAAAGDTPPRQGPLEAGGQQQGSNLLRCSTQTSNEEGEAKPLLQGQGPSSERACGPSCSSFQPEPGGAADPGLLHAPNTWRNWAKLMACGSVAGSASGIMSGLTGW